MNNHTQGRSHGVIASINEDQNIDLPNGTAKKKLYFNPAYFEPEMLQVCKLFENLFKYLEFQILINIT